MSRLTTTPAYCASCFQQRTEMRHIDFEAAYDGPVLPGAIKVAIDDLVLCEQCLNEAFVLLDPEGQQAEIERLTEKVAHLQKALDRRERTISGYNLTNNELVGISREAGNLKHGGGRPTIGGVDDEAKKVINARLNAGKARKKERQLRKREAALEEKEKA